MNLLELNRAVIRREANGKTIWQPRIGCYLDDRRHDNRPLDPGYEGCNEITLYEKLGCSDRLYVFNNCLKVTFDESVRVERIVHDPLTEEIIYHTPVGKVNMILKGNTSNYGKMPEKWFVENAQDMRVMGYVEENTNFSFDYEEYKRLYAERSHLGLPAMFLPRTNIQRLYLDICGVENAIYALEDYPDEVEAYFEILERSQARMLDVVADSPIEWINYGDNLHNALLSPKLFKKYLLPAYQRRNERLHRAGKFTFSHWDGDCGLLLPYAHETGLDGIEAITPKPQGDVTVDEIKKALGNDMFLIDGVAAILFNEYFPEERLIKQTEEVLNKFEGQLVLGISDELPSDGKLSRVERVRDMVEDFNAKH